MKLSSTPLAICVFLTSAACTWDATRDSDSITFQAGESVARARVLQAGEIWPPLSIDNDIEFGAARMLAAPSGDGSASSSASDSSAASIGAPAGAAQ